MVLREGHRARVEPHVDHLRHSPHRLLAARLRAGEGHLVDIGPVVVLQARPGELLELAEGADHARVAGGASPHRQRRSPVALPRQGPVDVVLQPVPETAVLDARGVPADGLVGRQQLVPELRGGDVPGGFRVVDQRVAGAPAMRVGMLVVLHLQHQPAATQVLDQLSRDVLALHLPPLIGLALPVADGPVEGAVRPHGIRQRPRLRRVECDPLRRSRDAVVVLAEGRREVHDARAVVGRHELVAQDREVARLAHVEDRPPIGAIALRELSAGEHLEHLGLLPQHRLHACLGEQVGLPA